MDEKAIVEREITPYAPTLDQNRRETAGVNTVGNGYVSAAQIKHQSLETHDP